MILKSFFTVLFFITVTAHSEDDELSTVETKVDCRKSNPLIASNKTDLYDVLETNLNETVILECHYCNEQEEGEAKIWYKIDQTNSTSHEVKIDMDTDTEKSRIFVNTNHDLTMKNIEPNDAGLYFCRGLEEVESMSLFNYILDIVFRDNETAPPERGNLTDWREYHEQHLAPINELFSTSQGTELSDIRDNFKTNLEVFTAWETNWKPCEICGRPQGDGIQEKFGHCRIKIENDITEEKELENLNMTAKLKYFLNISEVSCQSVLFHELFPAISNITKNLPDFVLSRHCEGICSPDGEGKGWKFGKSKGFKYRKINVIDEGTHLTLVCPESSLDNRVIWRRNGKALKQGESLMEDKNSIPHLAVDAFNTLYLKDVTKDQEGNYTCQVDDIRMQQVRVFVVEKAKIITREFARHLLYLGFILILTSSCYCAGIIAACKKRHKFKGYEEVRTEIV